MDGFLTQLLTMLGYQLPELLACGECGRYDGGPFAFLPANGSLLCGSCAETCSRLSSRFPMTQAMSCRLTGEHPQLSSTGSA